MKFCKKCSAKFDGRECKICHNARSKKWAADHPERVKASTEKWHAANPEKLKENIARWRLANPERVRELKAKWRATNPEKRRVMQHNRRARIRTIGGKLSKGLIGKIFALQRGKCPCCGRSLGDDYHLDHKMPLARGGANEDKNMQLLRRECNLQKKAKHPVDFMQSRGFLL